MTSKKNNVNNEYIQIENYLLVKKETQYIIFFYDVVYTIMCYITVTRMVNA